MFTLLPHPTCCNFRSICVAALHLWSHSVPACPRFQRVARRMVSVAVWSLNVLQTLSTFPTNRACHATRLVMESKELYFNRLLAHCSGFPAAGPQTIASQSVLRTWIYLCPFAKQVDRDCECQASIWEAMPMFHATRVVLKQMPW